MTKLILFQESKGAKGGLIFKKAINVVHHVNWMKERKIHVIK